MPHSANPPTVTLEIPEHTLVQLDTLVRQGRFATRQAAVVAAVERLSALILSPHPARQEALTRLCGALHVGTTPQSLQAAEQDRLVWESGQP